MILNSTPNSRQISSKNSAEFFAIRKASVATHTEFSHDLKSKILSIFFNADFMRKIASMSRSPPACKFLALPTINSALLTILPFSFIKTPRKVFEPRSIPKIIFFPLLNLAIILPKNSKERKCYLA